MHDNQNKEKKVLLTGITSFTGSYIAKELLDTSFNVCAPLLRKADQYKGLKKKRLDLCERAQIFPEVDISRSEFISFIHEFRPDFFINHGGYIENYRVDDFDFLKHLEVNLKNIKELTANLKKNGCKLFIHSGSAFEPGGEYGEFGVSPYGVAKKMVWDMTLFWCKKYQLPCSKIVIPNPYGLYENEDRLLPIFHKKITNQEQVNLSFSETVRNNIRVEDLAKSYLDVINKAINKQSIDLIIEPKGYIETQKEFVLRALQEEPYSLNLQDIEKYLICN